MKIYKFILSLFLVACIAFPAFAGTQKFIAIAMNDFSTDNPPQKFSVKISGNYPLKNGEYIYDGTVLTGEITKVVPETRGKRRACAYMRLRTFQLPDTNVVKTLDRENLIIKISAYEPIDISEKAVDAGVSAVGFVVKNAAYPINFVRGVVNPEDENKNRFVSGVETVYQKSVFSYFSKGEPLVLTRNSQLLLTVKYKEEEE